MSKPNKFKNIILGGYYLLKAIFFTNFNFQTFYFLKVCLILVDSASYVYLQNTVISLKVFNFSIKSY